MPSFSLHPRFARRLPDPFSNSTHGTERHIFFVPVNEIPPGISLDPSPRTPNTRWDIYKEVQASLLNQSGTPGTFHLKNRGITILARHVEKIDESEYQIDLDEGQGILDGAHTYRLIIEAQQDKSVKLPQKQFVRIEVVTKLPSEWVTEVSAALSTSIQGQRDSMKHLQDALQWIKDELRDQRYFKSIAWSETERGLLDVKDLLCIMTCFNTSSYPNSGSHHPVVAYENKSIVLSSFEADYKNEGGKAYRRLRPILKDILSLHDIIQLEFPKFHQQHNGGAPQLIERSTKRPFEFPFLQTKSSERLARGALLPLLAAFRWLVEDDAASGAVRWRGGLEAVLRRWRDLAEKLVLQTAERCREVGGNADAIGKSATHWSMLHKEVALSDLIQGPRQAPPPQPDLSNTATLTAADVDPTETEPGPAEAAG